MRFSVIAIFSLASVAFTQSSSSSAVVSIATAPGIETNVSRSSTHAIAATPTANFTGSLSSVYSSASAAVSSAIANATSNHPLPTGNATIPAIIGGNSTLGNGTTGGNGTSTASGSASGSAASSSTSAKSSADKLVLGGLFGLIGGAVGVLFV